MILPAVLASSGLQADTIDVPLAAQIEQQVANLNRDPIVNDAYGILAALREISNERMVALNETPAPPFEEAERAAHLQRLFADVGLGPGRIDAAGNVLVRLPGTDPARTVAVIAHVDTVFPAETDVSVKIDGDTYQAPGIGDNTRGLVLMLALAETLQRAQIQPEASILFVGSVGEEGLGDLRGVRYLFGPDSPRIDAAIVIDGGSIERVVTTAVGSKRYRVVISGPGGHSYSGFGRAHPHQALAGAIGRLTVAGSEIVSRSDTKATFSVGRIGGGTSINSIPFESWMEVDLRSADSTALSALDDALRSAVTAAVNEENERRREGAALSFELKPVGDRPGGQLADDAPLALRALAAQRAHGVIGTRSASSTDANVPIALGIPAVTISRGGISRNAHSLQETWQDQNTLQAEKIALLLLLASAGVATDAAAN